MRNLTVAVLAVSLVLRPCRPRRQRRADRAPGPACGSNRGRPFGVYSFK